MYFPCPLARKDTQEHTQMQTNTTAERHKVPSQMTHYPPERLKDNRFSHTEGDTQPPLQVRRGTSSFVVRWSQGSALLLGPCLCSDSRVVRSGTHSWVLGPPQDGGSCPWQRERSRRKPKQTSLASVCQGPGSGGARGRYPGSWRWGSLAERAFYTEMWNINSRKAVGLAWRREEAGACGPLEPFFAGLSWGLDVRLHHFLQKSSLPKLDSPQPELHQEPA